MVGLVFVQVLMSAGTFPFSRICSAVAFQYEPLEGNDRMCDVIRDFANKQAESIRQKYFAVCFTFQLHCNIKDIKILPSLACICWRKTVS